MLAGPKVSIVIPVYNGANFMRTAIDSALAQTYRNLEILVINDGSRDQGKTHAIAKSYGDRIRYFCKENGGVSSALNLGLTEMTGEYFAWLSHDDAFAENRIEEDVRLLERTPDARVTFCNIKVINEAGKIVAEPEYPIHVVKSPADALALGGVDFCAMTVHRSCFDEVGFFNENSKTMQDVEMSLMLSRKFIFYNNGKAYVFKRRHAAMGTKTMRATHRSDGRRLMEFVHENFSIDDIFPGAVDSEGMRLSEVWERMGDIYAFFHSFGYANECYARAVAESDVFFGRAGLKRLLGSRIVHALRYLKQMAIPSVGAVRGR